MPEEPFAKVKTYPGFEAGWNRLQAVTEIAVALVVLAGLFGTGPLSSASAQGQDGGSDDAEMMRPRLTRQDIEAQMRDTGIRDLSRVERINVEHNGGISIIEDARG